MKTLFFAILIIFLLIGCNSEKKELIILDNSKEILDAYYKKHNMISDEDIKAQELFDKEFKLIK